MGTPSGSSGGNCTYYCDSQHGSPDGNANCYRDNGNWAVIPWYQSTYGAAWFAANFKSYTATPGTSISEAHAYIHGVSSTFTCQNGAWQYAGWASTGE
jgi:hypothetical protein